jgi:hypothetical protein
LNNRAKKKQKWKNFFNHFQSKDSFLKRLDILQDKICKEGPNSVKLMGQVQTIAPPFTKQRGEVMALQKKPSKQKDFQKEKRICSILEKEKNL